MEIANQVMNYLIHGTKNMYLEFKVLCDTWANSIINLFTYKLEIYIYI